MYCILATIVALAYIFWDVNYFLRIAFTIGIGRLFGKKCGVNDTTTIYGKSGITISLMMVGIKISIEMVDIYIYTNTQGNLNQYDKNRKKILEKNKNRLRRF